MRLARWQGQGSVHHVCTHMSSHLHLAPERAPACWLPMEGEGPAHGRHHHQRLQQQLHSCLQAQLPWNTCVPHCFDPVRALPPPPATKLHCCGHPPLRAWPLPCSRLCKRTASLGKVEHPPTHALANEVMSTASCTARRWGATTQHSWTCTVLWKVSWHPETSLVTLNHAPPPRETCSAAPCVKPHHTPCRRCCRLEQRHKHSASCRSRHGGKACCQGCCSAGGSGVHAGADG